MSGMAAVVLVYHGSPLALPDGPVYTAQACGRERDDGTWEGWLEFLPDDDSGVLRSRRETTQPTFAALEYWATGITPVYLEGALERTLTAPPGVVEPPLTPAVYDEPAPADVPVVEAAPVAEAATGPEPVLDPFSVYARGEDRLRRQLAALSARHLRDIVVGYELADPADIDLDALTGPELIELIAGAVRERLAA
jgi:hypothetical protein